ncbi:glycosyltransferase [Terrisporobacter petrolearius]|uniref:glycosyltransferase n=1 Tax=Terrisporobacter petrolearius TaxID=1460447 RepID=UPI001D16D727|nr:glycosyltransferase [Terrisporobacter petrolearius]MCC3865797.1 glycosyltransferase [Terrisporobacter petrolearius]
MSSKLQNKKIAIITRKMITGGVEKALLGMLDKMDFRNIEVDLYLEQLGGELFDDIPKEVNIIKIPTIKDNNVYILKHPIKYLETIYFRIKIRNESNYLKQCKLAANCLPIVDEKYDMAISYHAPNTIPVFYTINNINADKKVLWLHGDLESNDGLCKEAYDYYKLYDKVFAVSRNVKESFDNNYLDLSYKSEIFYNYINEIHLRTLSNKGDSFDDEFLGIRILTIGRLDYQKGYDLAIKVCYKLKNEGYKIKWYVCGDGNYRHKVENLISKYRVKKEFILLGNQVNPYGYLKDCDIYAQTSRSEGYCTTTNEARILLKPVVTTNVSGATEQFENNKTGIITPITVEGIYEGLKVLIENEYKRNELSENLKVNLKNKNEDIEKLTNILYSM